MTTPIQSVYRRYEQAGWPGGLARPNAPYAYDSGVIRVPTGGTDPAPGYAVVWDATNNRFALPTTDAEQQLVCGILSYDGGVVAQTLGTTTENSPVGVQFANGSVIKVGVLGTFYGIAAEAMEYGDPVEWEWRNSTQSPPLGASSAFRWKKRTTFGMVPTLPAAGQTNGLPDTGDFGDTSVQTGVKAAVDHIASVLFDRLSTVYRLPISVANPEPVAAGGLVQLRVGYSVR